MVFSIQLNRQALSHQIKDGVDHLLKRSPPESPYLRHDQASVGREELRGSSEACDAQGAHGEAGRFQTNCNGVPIWFVGDLGQYPVIPGGACEHDGWPDLRLGEVGKRKWDLGRQPLLQV